MKNYIVKVIKSDGFDDKEENLIHRTKNDIFNCTKERYEFLKKNNAVVLMGIEKQDEYKRGNIVKEFLNQEEEMLEKGAGLSDIMYKNADRDISTGELITSKPIKVSKKK